MCCRCIAVCCSALQCVAMHCSALQVYCIVLQVLPCIAVYCSALPCIAVCCSVLQCVAVCCSCRVLQQIAVSHSRLPRAAATPSVGACKIICRVHLLIYLLCQMTVELAFENFGQPVARASTEIFKSPLVTIFAVRND